MSDVDYRTTIEWKDLAAGEELDCLIAVRLGATNLRKSGLSGFWYADFPEGNCLSVLECSIDLNAAFALPIGDNYGYISRANGICTGRIANPNIEHDGDKAEIWRGDAGNDEPALAYTRAWLSYMDAKESK